MTYDDMYPNEPVDFWTHDNADDDGVIKVSNSRPCWECERPTAFVDLDFQAHLCSPECRDLKWNEYFRALSANARYYEGMTTWPPQT